jgi:chromosome segregation ATPase
MITSIRNCVALILLLSAAAALPQTERSGSADARVMQQLQQLTTERVGLQAENAKLKQDLERAQKELQKATSGRAALENRARALEASASRGEAATKQSEEQLERTRTQLQELITKFRETAQTLRDVETDRATARSQLAVKERELTTCVDRNARLYTLNAEVLDRLEGRGFWSAVGSAEPFTKLKRVQLENLIDDYRYRVEELRVEQARKSAQAAPKEQ